MVTVPADTAMWTQKIFQVLTLDEETHEISVLEEGGLVFSKDKGPPGRFSKPKWSVLNTYTYDQH